MIVKLIKSKEELKTKGDEIINSLDGYNIAEKWFIMSALYHSLEDTIIENGWIIEEREKE